MTVAEIRAKFEPWAWSQGYTPVTDENGRYEDAETRAAWDGYLAGFHERDDEDHK